MVRFAALFGAIVLFAVTSSALAQLPTATGRSFTLSNSAWSVFIPSDYVQRGAVADLVVHFHGDSQTYRNNAKWAKLNAIIVTVNYGGLSSAYSTPFANDVGLFNTIMTEARTRVRTEADFPDNLVWDKLAATSFSAGYGAVREIIKQPGYFNEIDMIAACDTIYAGFVNYPSNLQLINSQMVDFREYADAAEAGDKTFIVSHSQVDPVTYASTVLTANDLVSHVGGSFQTYNATGLGTLGFYRRSINGSLKVYGATGADGDAHLEHLQYAGQFLNELPLARVPEPSSVTVALISLGSFARRRCRGHRSSIRR